MLVYKGVGPGTYYFNVSPNHFGFHGDPNEPDDAHHVAKHIADHSWPSAFVSLSMSFAVAADYAGSGGWVYEISIPDDRLTSVVIDPVGEIVTLVTPGHYVHSHDGPPVLIEGIANPGGAGGASLTAFPLRPSHPVAPAAPPPNASPKIKALVRAIRDAELLAKSVPRGWINRTPYLIP